MIFDSTTYEARLRRAGFNPNTWAKHCGVNRSTVIRQCSGKTDPIPEIYWRKLHDLDGKGYP